MRRIIPRDLGRLRALVWTWGPVLLVMLILFVSSAQPKIERPDSRDRIYFSGLMPIFPSPWEYLIKKSGHVLAYTLLTAASLRALILSGRAGPPVILGALLIALVYACSDELHQSFTAGRTPSPLDVGFDMAGAALALLARRLARLWPDRGHAFK